MLVYIALYHICMCISGYILLNAALKLEDKRHSPIECKHVLYFMDSFYKTSIWRISVFVSKLQ